MNGEGVVRFVAVFLHRTSREAARQVVEQGFFTGRGVGLEFLLLFLLLREAALPQVGGGAGEG